MRFICHVLDPGLDVGYVSCHIGHIEHRTRGEQKARKLHLQKRFNERSDTSEEFSVDDLDNTLGCRWQKTAIGESIATTAHNSTDKSDRLSATYEKKKPWQWLTIDVQQSTI